MNKFTAGLYSHQTLYTDLMVNCTKSEAFYYYDYVVDGYNYRVFNYRLASYTDFLLPNALEARGITFFKPDDSHVVLVSLPFSKFFNVGECPFTMNLDFSKVTAMATKEDGSIISTYFNPITGKVGVKSKQDFFSAQSVMATECFNSEKYEELRLISTELAEKGEYTVIMELVSPHNRIILEYPETELRVIGLRDMKTGECFSKSSAVVHYSGLDKYWTEEYVQGEFPVKIEDIPDMEGIEGFVLTFDNGQKAKIKTKWYQTLHHVKDSISSERRLFNAIIDEYTDDVKAMFADDAETISRIKAMEDIVVPRFNHIARTIDRFYASNKHLDRKSYAIKGQTDEEVKPFFSLVMEKYLGRELDLKEFAKKYRKEWFGISDVEVEPEDGVAISEETE